MYFSHIFPMYHTDPKNPPNLPASIRNGTYFVLTVPVSWFIMRNPFRVVSNYVSKYDIWNKGYYPA